MFDSLKCCGDWWKRASGFLCNMEDGLGMMIQRMTLTEEEALEVVMPEDLDKWRPRRFLLVGRLLTNKPYKMECLMATMKALWSPKNDRNGRLQVSASVLEGSDRIVFSFPREYDQNRVLRGCPWHFDKVLFAVAATDGREDLLRVSLNWQFFWIRAWGVPPLNMVRETGERIGDAVGMFARMGEEKHGMFMGSSLPVRVLIDTNKPLRRVDTVRLPWHVRASHFEIDYIRLPSFCHYCGLLSHGSSQCIEFRTRVIKDVQFDTLLCAEKRDVWLLEKLKKEEVQPPETRWAGCRYGLFESPKGGWTMQAPEFSLSGMVRTRSEWEEEIPGSLGYENMIVDDENDESRVPAKRRRVGIKRPESDMEGERNPRDLAFNGSPGSEACLMMVENIFGKPEVYALSRKEEESLGAEDPTSNLVREGFKEVITMAEGESETADSSVTVVGQVVGLDIEPVLDVEANEVVGKVEGVVKGSSTAGLSISNSQRDQMQADLVPTPSRPSRKGGEEKPRKGRRGFVVGCRFKKNKEGNNSSRNKNSLSLGRAPQRPSVMGPVLTHHAQ